MLESFQQLLGDEKEEESLGKDFGIVTEASE